MRRSTTLLATRSFSRGGSSLLTSTRTSFAASSLFSRRAYGTNDSHVPQPTAADARIAPEKLRTYTREEVAKHAYEDDCWVIVNGRVYNVSTWADLHPGGRAVLHAHAGGDATDLWVEVGHTARARALMERYCIGKVEEPKRYTGYEHHVIDIDNSGYTLPAGADKEEILEDVSSYRYSTR